jgi:hypothetical protein
MATVKISTKFFHWDKETNCFITEVSDCSDQTAFLSQVGRNGSFTLVSEKTQKEIHFQFVKIDQNADREIQGWRFAVVGNQAHKHPELPKITALVIND